MGCVARKGCACSCGPFALGALAPLRVLRTLHSCAEMPPSRCTFTLYCCTTSRTAPQGTKVARGYYADNGPPTTLSGNGRDYSLSYQHFTALDDVQFVNGNQLGTRALFQVGGWAATGRLCLAPWVSVLWGPWSAVSGWLRSSRACMRRPDSVRAWMETSPGLFFNLLAMSWCLCLSRARRWTRALTSGCPWAVAAPSV